MNLLNFFSELQHLLQKYPHLPPNIISSENCDFGDKIYHSKNLMYSFDDANCTDAMYLYDSYLSPNCHDSDYCVESELCYESVDAIKCYNCDFVDYCVHCQDISYSYNCMNCHHVFGSANLLNKSFCIFNRQCTENEYAQKINLYKTWPQEKILDHLEQIKIKYPLTQTHEGQNENSPYGNYVGFCKNCYMCFDAGHSEDCCYMYDSFYNKMCYDTTYATQNNQLSYEIVDSGDLFNCNYSVFSNKCHNSSYLFNCSNVQDSFGCVSLSNKKNCLLNRQLSADNYEKLKSIIMTQLYQEKSGWNNLVFNS